MFKSLAVVIALMVSMMSVASAAVTTPFWVGTGVFEAASANLSVVTYAPYRTPEMNTEQDCINYLADAQALILFKNVKGNLLQHKIHAVCVQGNSIP